MKKNQFIPAKQAEVMEKAGQFNAKITAPDFDPATVGLTAGDVTAFTAAYNAAKAAYVDPQRGEGNQESQNDRL